MVSLVVVLWAVYLSECLAGVRAGEWVFKGRSARALRGTGEPDLTLFGGAKGFAWLPVAPWHVALRCGAARLDDTAADEPVSQLVAATRPLRIASSALFVLLLPLLTVLVATGRTAPLFGPWAAVTLVAWVVSAWLFWRAYRRVHGRRPPAEVAAHLLSPVGLSRGALAIAFSAPVRAHPVAVAAAVCDDEQFLRVARVFRFDEPEARGAIDALVLKRALTEALDQQPEPEHRTLTRYCPRCHATYRQGAALCADCAGVPLRDLAIG
jgi:hypothetical protein